MAEDVKKERVSPYRLSLEPNVEARRPEWDLIFISDTRVTVDFYHTDMLEKVVSIKKVEEGTEKEGKVVG